MRPILASVLVLVCAHGAVADTLADTYGTLFNDHVDITFSGYSSGSNIQTNFPLLVRLSEGNPAGFSYKRVDKLGKEIRFLYYGVSGSDPVAVPYEVDTWNTSGTSTLWVKLPALNNGSSRKLTMYWAPSDSTSLPANVPSSVWSDFTAVWHMNGPVDSSPNDIAAVAGSAATVGTGQIGSALVSASGGSLGPLLSASAGTVVDNITTGAYTISGWMRVDSLANGSSWFYTRKAAASDNAYGAEIASTGAGVGLKLHASASDVSQVSSKASDIQEWVHLAIESKGPNGAHAIYKNGVKLLDWTASVTDVNGSEGFALGGLFGTGAAGTLAGALDEVRIFPGLHMYGSKSLGASWAKAEYEQVTNPDYLTFGTVSSTGAEVYPEDEEEEDDDSGSGGNAESTGSSSSTADYAGTAIFTPGELDEGVTLTNFVMLVQVWEGSPVGFVPSQLPFGTEDIRFFDEKGECLDYDLELWDENGTSVFWVKVPYLKSSSRITMCWGLREGRTLPEIDSTAVWSEYAGVWHMEDATDSTVWDAPGSFGANATNRFDGAIGHAAQTKVTGANGAILDVEASQAVEALTNDSFTVSGYVLLNRTATKYGYLFSRASADDPAWGAQFCGGTSGDSSQIAMHAGQSSAQGSVSISASTWYRFDFVYASDRLTFYLNGTEICDSPASRTIFGGTSGRLAIGSLVSTSGLAEYTLNGAIDEFRLRAGRPSANEMTAERKQVSMSSYYEKSAVVWDESAILQNRWIALPSLSKTVWKQGEDPAVISTGLPWYGTVVVTYVNRETGDVATEMPTEGGDYRAVFTVPQTGRYSSLTYEINFRIRTFKPSHDLGAENDRVLVLSDDRSISDGLVEIQAYNHTVQGLERPYWWHDVDSGLDYTATSPYYNYCGGTHHTYYGSDDTRYWDLIDVRYGNTYNNADEVFDRTGEWEEWSEGLSSEMNYLPWNPDGGRLIDDSGDTAEGWHEFAAQAVMCNTLKASINSGLYTNGIGTIYFDCVNSHTNDAPLGYYKLVVEFATNALNRSTGAAEGLPTDENIAATHPEWVGDERIDVVHDAYKFADWQRLPMNVRLVKDGVLTTNLWTTEELTLNLADGGSYKNFYRVYVPLDVGGAARFRIRRTAVSPEYTLNNDYHSLILVDNVICSKPTDRISVEPRGFYDPLKVKRETVGYEGAFNPSYPSVNDTEVYARVRVKDLATGQPKAGSISAIGMHYRWRYLDQQTTEWLTTDIDPLTLQSEKALSLPGYAGDIEYWFEVNQSGEFYSYADYTGLNLGLDGYSEAIASVTNRADTYETYGKDWFTRIRDGKSACGNVKLYVRRGEDGAEETVEMFLARDQVWRGCMLTTNAISDGVWYRFETINRQDDTLADFQYNTNGWYHSEEADALPVSGKLVAGTTNNWGHIPCDAATGFVLFQIDDETRALTVVHADWQDFNAWNDADGPYFVGSSADDSQKKGTSVARREYAWDCALWETDCATNDAWTEAFAPNTWEGYAFFKKFREELSPNGFDIGEGMWVPGAYADVREHHSGMALQMTGQGRGYAKLADPNPLPRGIESVKFNARLAQSVSPDQFSIFDDGARLNDYSFLTRVAFDLNGNSNFIGNASLSLAAFLRDKKGCYEARWEQIDGDVEDGSGTILGPVPRGQRLAIYRWRYSGQSWVATEVMAATNSSSSGCNWQASVCPRAIPATYSITNNLMPFYIGAYNNTVGNYTVVIAGVRIGGGTTEADNRKGGVAADAEMSYLNSDGWLYVVYRDTSADRLKSGTYGVLASNCEGVFVRPQYHQGIVSWQSDSNLTKTLSSCICPDGASGRAGYQSAHFLKPNATNCVDDIIDEWWSENSGRMGSFYETPYDNFFGFTNQIPSQTVNVYLASHGTENWSLAGSRTLTGFGTPGILRDTVFDFWSVQDSDVKIAPGGTLDDVQTDVVVDNIQISQWRGNNWLGNTDDEKSKGGLTNFVYTSGWELEDALQLSAKRTPSGTPSSLRVPLCDGGGRGAAVRGLGLGLISFEYRNATTNMRLQVQIITNNITANNLLTKTLSFDDWTTITNWDFSTGLYPTSGYLYCSPGLHGVSGTMRLVVDSTLVDEVKTVTDPTAFGSIEIVQVFFRDEPPLDAGCWWGWNIRTLGDKYDSESRMYLPDNPYRTIPPAPEEIGRSLALNNSITDGVDPTESAKTPNPFAEHMPFLQTPTFASNIVGEVSFKARKYSLNKGSQNAEITLYGTREEDVSQVPDSRWESLQIFVVSNTLYESYSFKINPGEGYRAFRLAVTGVDGVSPYPGPDPTSGDEPVRVLIDDVLVSEAIRARLAFRNVGAFRHQLAETTYVPNVPSTYEQPIVGEGWGVQAEIYAAMLGEEIDMTVPPRVKLHYYTGTYPWGYSQWRDRSDAKSGWLSAASDTNYIYRSSYIDSPDAVIAMASKPNTVVQYMLEVVYTIVNSETGYRTLTTNLLESVDWQTPSWYSPIDYNASKGSAANFAAYTIIDEIAPGWAWINEANIFGALSGSKNTEENHQYVEIAKPAEYDLKNWELRMLSYKSGSSTPETASIVTNTVARFGDGNVSKTKSKDHMADTMTFMVVACPASEDKTLWRSSSDDSKDETLDGTWKFDSTDSTTFKTGGTIGYYSPIGIQLVRPTGIVEHEIVCIGTNKYATSQYLRDRYEPTNLVNRLNVVDATKRFFLVGSDNGGAANSLGVYDSRGEAAAWWNNSMKMTPGRINENQHIEDHPTPEGEMIIVFAEVDTAFGHIYQTVGAGTNTTASQMVSVKRDNESGLNIRYTVDPWYELGAVKEMEGSTARVPIISTNAVRSYTVNVAKHALKNVTVEASAAVAKNLRDLGLTENNRYTPAVLRWLEKHTDAFGNDFYDWGSGNVYLAKFQELSGGVTDMTLTQMYWLDMDPTVSNMFFCAGMVRPPSPVVLKKPTYKAGEDQSYTNLRMGIYMAISNGNENVDTRMNGKIVWAPYVLRGLGPDEISWDYSTNSPSASAWTSVTFKVTGFLDNGLNKFDEKYTEPDGSEYYANLIPLRYFVFNTESFDANFESEIDIEDPFSVHSLAYSYGWYDWARKYGKDPVYFAWGIDSRLKQVTAETLAPTNRLYTFP